MKKILLAALLIAVASCTRTEDGTHTLHVLSTNDVHGAYFDSTYVGTSTRPSLFAVKHSVDSLREAFGSENVLLIDVGDALQGDNAAFYFNYEHPELKHVFPRMASYIGYDVTVLGNHDVETGHPVYDRIRRELKSYGIPYLAGNAVKEGTGTPYFCSYAIFRRAGLKVAVIGYTNANIKAWLDEGLWEGIDFRPIAEVVQKDVDAVRKKEKPDVVIVAAHTGTGAGDGSMLENEGLDILNSVEGVDFVLNAHDHLHTVINRDSLILINSGCRSRYLGHGVLTVDVAGGKTVARKAEAELITIDRNLVDEEMREAFHKDYLAVKDFTVREIGTLTEDLRSRDAYKGVNDYMDLIHFISLKNTGADISFAAPLSYDSTVKAGTLLYNDLFSIYPYENQLFTLEMTGEEIKNYLEYSYSIWINTISSSQDHLLDISKGGDPRNGSLRWRFNHPTFNFDSAAGIIYTVDVTKPAGERININSMADGSLFEMSGTYKVAMTSYRASGGGFLLSKGAGIADSSSRIVAKYPEIRNMIYDFITENKVLDPSVYIDRKILGNWNFVPEEMASEALDRDYVLLFD